MKTVNLITIVIICFFGLFHKAQAQPVSYSASLNPNDVIILNQEDTINIVAKKLGFRYFQFIRKTKIKIMNENGVKSFSSYKLPETYDPSYISQSPKVKKYGYYLSNVEIGYFKVKVFKKGNVVVNPKIISYQKECKSVTLNNKYGNYYLYFFDIPGLTVGDELEISYSYNVPFDENLEKLLSFRLFAHSYYNIANYQLTIISDKDLSLDFNYVNSFNPDTSGIIGMNRFSKWLLTDIPGCMGEVSGRPYKSLPHLVFSIKPGEIPSYMPDLYTLQFDKTSIPSYFIPVYYRERNCLRFFTTKNDYLAVQTLIKENYRDTINDTANYKKFFYEFNLIAETFNYDNSKDFFGNIYATDSPPVRECVETKKIHESNRYYVYVASLEALNMFYYTTYLADIRSGEISEHYYTPMFMDDFLLAIQFDKGNIVFFYPKKDDFGFYTDEVPFYFEGAKTRLICLEDYEDETKPINADFRTITTPTSTWNDNTRKCNIMVNLSIDEPAKFSAVLNLSGQFSTMTRGTYINNYNDPTVNPLYSHKIWDVSSTVSLLSSNVDIKQKKFPYKTVIKAEYEIPEFVTKINDSTYSILLKNLFPHIIYSGLNESYRVLDYYPDFKGQDMFSYYIKFQNPVEIIKNIETQKISNSFGELVIESVPISQDGLRITSCLSINNDCVKAANIQNVLQIFESIRNFNNEKIAFKLKH